MDVITPFLEIYPTIPPSPLHSGAIFLRELLVNIFHANQGMQRRSFHIVDSLFVYAIDSDTAKLTKCGDAITNGRFSCHSKANGGKQYLTKDQYVMIEVSQNGYKQPTYNSRFIIKLGGDWITKVTSFTEDRLHPTDNLYFEAQGKLLNPEDVIKLGMSFVFNKTRTPPKEIERSLISVTRVKPTQNRGITILKQGGK